MLHDRIHVLALLETISGSAGKRSDSEAQLLEFLDRCRQSDSGARKAVLECRTDKPLNDEDLALLERCRTNDPTAWEQLITSIEAPLLKELRTQNLIARCLAGNSDASVELFRSIEQKAKGLLCFRIFYKLTEEDVQDLSMMVAAKVFRELPKYDTNKASFETFWRLLLDQIYKDYLDKRNAQKRSGIEISMDEPGEGQGAFVTPEPGVGPDEQAVMEDEFRMLRDALEKLGPPEVRCRRMFELFYFEENSYAEIAVALNMNAKTVSTGLVRCREKVREYFPKEFREQARQYPE